MLSAGRPTSSPKGSLERVAGASIQLRASSSIASLSQRTYAQREESRRPAFDLKLTKSTTEGEDFMTKQTNHRLAATRSLVNLLGSLVIMLSFTGISDAQTVPPTPPTGLTATAATCGQVNLSWGAAIDNSGTGLKAYSIWRTDNGVNSVTSIGAARTWFDDTVWVKSSTTMSYYVMALDTL